jgi:FkbM family methyltransferase
MSLFPFSRHEHERVKAERERALADRDRLRRERDAVAAECYRLAELLPQPGRMETSDIASRDFETFRICGWLGDATVSQYVLNGSYEPDVTAAFRKYVKPGMYVADIGANIGYFTMMAASLVGPEGLVDAIEANPRNAALIEVNRRLNGFGQVRIANVAVGREMGLLSLKADHSTGFTPRLAEDAFAPLNGHTVPCFPLGQILQAGRKLDAIKIDIDGAEYMALSAAADILKRDRPLIFSEFAPWALQLISGVTEADYLSLLLDCGFELGVILPTGDIDLCGQDIDQVIRAHRASAGEHIDIIAFPAREGEGRVLRTPRYATDPEFHNRVRTARDDAVGNGVVFGSPRYFELLRAAGYVRGPIEAPELA